MALPRPVVVLYSDTIADRITFANYSVVGRSTTLNKVIIAAVAKVLCGASKQWPYFVSRADIYIDECHAYTVVKMEGHGLNGPASIAVRPATKPLHFGVRVSK